MISTQALQPVLTTRRGTRAVASALLAGVALLCLGSASARADAPQFGMENGATRLCASSGSGAAGTLVRQEPCSEYYSHDGAYQEYWATEDLTPGEHLQTFHEQAGTAMCLTIRNGALRVRTPLVIEPCGGSIAVGQEFDRLATTDGGALLRAYAESGRRVDNPTELSRYCIGTGGGPGSILRLERCDNRLTRQSWFGLSDEGSPGLPGPGPDSW